jgi:hypothetical protein
VKLANNPMVSSKTKHVDIKHHYIRELVDTKTDAFVSVGTTHMLAGGLTKAPHININCTGSPALAATAVHWPGCGAIEAGLHIFHKVLVRGVIRKKFLQEKQWMPLGKT